MNNPLTTEQKAELEQKIREAANKEIKHDFCAQYDRMVVCEHCGIAETPNAHEMPCKKGRPLQLADVLIALIKHNSYFSIVEYSDSGVYINLNGTTTDDPVYNLTKDYHHQSEELYSFLYSLLINDWYSSNTTGDYGEGEKAKISDRATYSTRRK